MHSLMKLLHCGITQSFAWLDAAWNVLGGCIWWRIWMSEGSDGRLSLLSIRVRGLKFREPEAGIESISGFVLMQDSLSLLTQLLWVFDYIALLHWCSQLMHLVSVWYKILYLVFYYRKGIYSAQPRLISRAQQLFLFALFPTATM